MVHQNERLRTKAVPNPPPKSSYSPDRHTLFPSPGDYCSPNTQNRSLLVLSFRAQALVASEIVLQLRRWLGEDAMKMQ